MVSRMKGLSPCVLRVAGQPLCAKARGMKGLSPWRRACRIKGLSPWRRHTILGRMKATRRFVKGETLAVSF